jgi:hypothetical protein
MDLSGFSGKIGSSYGPARFGEFRVEESYARQDGAEHDCGDYPESMPKNPRLNSLVSCWARSLRARSPGTELPCRRRSRRACPAF